jgi:hypothetical protein
MQKPGKSDRADRKSTADYKREFHRSAGCQGLRLQSSDLTVMSIPMPGTCRCVSLTARHTFRFLLSHAFGKLGVGHTSRSQSGALVNRFRRRSRFRRTCRRMRTWRSHPGVNARSHHGLAPAGRRRRHLSRRCHWECLSRTFRATRRRRRGETGGCKRSFPRFWPPGSHPSDNARPLWTPQPAPHRRALRMPFARSWMPQAANGHPGAPMGMQILPKCCGATSGTTG